ncbi:MAG: ABC transporter permease subunit [Bacillota bacterium]|nr:ABC transporter permease subunit [Bacillota bacterium]
MLTNFVRKKNKRSLHVKQWPLHLMMMPAVALLLIFAYMPMAGNIIAFQRFIPVRGLFGDQQWVGLRNFIFMFKMPDTWPLFRNTMSIAIQKMIWGIIVPVSICLMLNEIRITFLKRSIQTLIYLPHFLSWVIFGGILIDILSPSTGIMNRFIMGLGGESVYFLGNPRTFQGTVVWTHIWKEFGFATIIYLAAISNIDPTQYESASIDGAKRWQKILHITLPGMRTIIILLATLSLGSILNAGFEQIFTLYNPRVYSTGDIIDTFVYRMGVQQAQYSLSTAVGLLKSVVSFFMISFSYYAASKWANYKIF